MVQEVLANECQPIEYSGLVPEEAFSETEWRAGGFGPQAMDWLLTRPEIRHIGTVSTDVGLEIAKEQNRRTMNWLLQWLKENGRVISYDHSEPHYMLSRAKWETLLRWSEEEKNLSSRLSRFDCCKHPWE